ncbi:MAG: AAA family ATPase [Solidesulfovibrio sp. DCME]|uniref:AAA family ATPase n=1 Tax=Solidesulfovibrio sp. DCME TaxID=3447380 RepID=UPI003D09C12D
MLELPGYAIHRLAREDGNARLYAATRLADGLPVTLKVAAAAFVDRACLAAFEREYAILRRLDGQGALKTHGLLRSGPQPALVLEDFPGLPLCPPPGGQRLPLDALLAAGAAAAEALGRIHAKDILLGGLSAETLRYDPAGDRAVFTDVSLALPMAEGSVADGAPASLAHLAHLAPERCGRPEAGPDWRADLYALGVAFHFLLTGRFPFTAADPLSLRHAHMSSAPVPPRLRDASIPEAVSKVLLKLLAKDPEDRYQSAFGLKADLEACRRALAAGVDDGRFVPGAADYSDLFRLSRRFHGREPQRRALLEAVGRLGEGGRELVLVSGYAGIGKTALVGEMRQPVAALGGRLAAGKFEALRRNVPFTALADALGRLVRDILAESPEGVRAWRKRLGAALGGLGQVLVPLVAPLETLLGPQPPVPQVPPREAASRLAVVFRNFLRALCRPKEPLVLFLDDLQWADAASLDLLAGILADAGLGHFLCLGAYRDDEVDAGHLLTGFLAGLGQAGVAVGTIGLGPLSLDAVAALLADSFQAPPEKLRELAAILHGQTCGNPFYLRQALAALHAEGALAFAPRTRTWSFDAKAIAARGLAENAAALLARDIGRLPGQSTQLLRLAACLGGAFDPADLAWLTGMSLVDVRAALSPALRRGLLSAPPAEAASLAWPSRRVAGGMRLAFAHDRVREAAAALWEAGELAAAHHRVAAMLLAILAPAEQEQRVFEITDHRNRALPAIDTPAERLDLAGWNLRAARQARQATAFAAALTYARQAASLLPDDAWAAAYDLALACCKERGLAEHLNLHFEEAEACYATGLAQAACLLDRCDFVNMRINQRAMTGRVAEAVAEAKAELARYGLPIPDRDIEGAVAREFERVGAIMAGRGPSAFADMPAMTDPMLVAASAIIDGVAPATYFYDRTLLALLGAMVVRLSLTHGYTKGTFPALGSHGRMLAAHFGQYRLGHEFARLGIDLCRRHGFLATLATTISTFVDTAYLFQDTDSISALLKEGVAAALASGDLYHVELLQAMQFPFDYFSGKHLTKTMQEIRTLYCGQSKLVSLIGYCLSMAYYFGVRTLAGEDCPEQPGDLDEKAFSERAAQSGQVSSLAYLHGVKGTAHYILGNLAEARACFARADQYSPTRELFMSCDLATFKSLLELATAEDPDALAGEAGRELEKNREELRLWSGNCPESFLARHLLVEAETARVRGEPLEPVLALYDRAIAAAEAHGLTHIAALAEEAAGNFWLARGKPDFAQAHLTRAWQGYRAWGAARKARELAAAHAALFARAQPSPLAGPGPDRAWRLTPDALGLRSLMKAVGAISGEMNLPRLAATLTSLAAENAGATGCLLLLRRGEGLVVLPGQSFPPDPLAVSAEVPLEDFPGAPAAIVRHTAATGMALLLADAAADRRFAADPYVARVRPRAVLCAPIARKERLVGIIYLENTLLRDAFTEERLEAVGLLAAQAAISLENAGLYEELRQAEARYRGVFENALVGILRVDASGRIRLANLAAARILGYASPGLAARAVTAIGDRVVDRSLYRRLLAGLRRGRPILERELRLRREGGETIWVVVSARPIVDEAGRTVAAEALFTDITRRKQAEARVHRLDREMLRLQEREWSRISMNLHDDVAQNLLAAKIQASRLFAGQPGPAPGPTVRQRLDELMATLGEATATIRDLSLSLRPPNLQRLGLAGALAGLCEELADKSGLSVVCLADGLDGLGLDHEAQVSLYRLVQEALNNIHKHAGASRVTVRFERAPLPACLRIDDDGRGFDPEAVAGDAARGRRMGLSTMRERARLIDGRLEIASRPGQGTCLSLVLSPPGAAYEQDVPCPSH